MCSLLADLSSKGVRPGAPSPLGVSYQVDGDYWNFAVWSRRAASITVMLTSRSDPAKSLFAVTLTSNVHRSGDIWHVAIPRSSAPGADCYGLSVDLGDHGDHGDHMCRSPVWRNKVLLDPYAREVWFPPGFSRAAASDAEPNLGRAPLAVLPTTEQPKVVPLADAARPAGHERVIYELHVRGFTARANSGVSAARQGTYAGVIDKIPYLRQLGITSIELLPIHQFDPDEGNYWGYMTLGFFAPHRQYSAFGDPRREFAEMVTRLHGAGFEVLLDVVFNHTTEAAESGPAYNFKVLGDEDYYLRTPTGKYDNSSGTGNVFRANHGPAKQLVTDSIEYWRDQYGVDGFRFDLASVLSRSAHGQTLTRGAPIFDDIGSVSGSSLLIAEAWDVATYQLGTAFPAKSWGQWNGKFRDDIRSFIRGDSGYVPTLMIRLAGSPDLFPPELGYRCDQSVNFVTAHDGFTMWDLVSYVYKRNLANGEGGRDGTDDNRSANWGWEGDEATPASVVALRKRQMRNFCALMMISAGTPMLVAGDEFANTQQGNNNPYNRDDETTWLDWDLSTKNSDLLRFFQLMIRFRRRHRSIGDPVGWDGRVHWHGVDDRPDVSNNSRSLAWFLDGAPTDDDDLYVMVNGWSAALSFIVFAPGPSEWRVAVDTTRASPDDIAEDPRGAEALSAPNYVVGPHSIVVLVRKRAT